MNFYDDDDKTNTEVLRDSQAERYSQSQSPNEPSICVFGTHELNPRRSSVVVFNLKREETVIAETEYRRLCSIACLNDILYICCGSTEPEDRDGVSYEVITVNVKTGDVGHACDTIYATNAAAAASSHQRIALCGGDVAREARNYCQMYSPERDEWEEFPSMNTPRYLFGLEWIPDGRLFAVGGVGGDRKPTATVEMLECSFVASEGKAKSKWRFVAPLLAPRRVHGVCYCAGKLLAVGGKRDATVECFTLPAPGNEMGEWTRIRPLNRDTTLAGVLPFGEDLLCVGFCKVNALYKFSKTKGELDIRRGNANAFPDFSRVGKVYGCCAVRDVSRSPYQGNEMASSTETFKITTDANHETKQHSCFDAPPPEDQEKIQEKSDSATSTEHQEDERDSFTFCLLATDKENMDEYKVIKFNPCTQYEETSIHQLPYRLGCAMAALGGKIYFIGGQTNRHFPQMASRTVSRLRFSDGIMERVESLLSPALRPAVATSQGLIAACGGTLNGTPVSRCQLFSLDNERWRTLPDMLEPRADFGIAWMPDGRLFAIGGSTGATVQTSSVEMLHCWNTGATTTNATDGWTYVAPLPTARQCHAATVLEGKVIVAGGLEERGVEYFTPPSDFDKLGQWTSIYSLPNPMCLLSLLPIKFGFIGICHERGTGVYLFQPSCSDPNQPLWDSGNWSAIAEPQGVGLVKAACAIVS